MLNTIACLACIALIVPLTTTATCSRQQTIINEGKRLCCYYDFFLIPTIGVGYNLQNPGADKLMQKYNLTLANVLQDCKDYTENNCLSNDAADEIFNTISYPEAEKCADEFAPGLPPLRRAAIIDMAFMGCSKLKGFTNMQKALKERNWTAAAVECKNSMWCADVGVDRCYWSDAICIDIGCQGANCGSITAGCSSRPDCGCVWTNNNNGFCVSNIPCAGLPDCRSCASPGFVCLPDTCCKTAVCVSASAECTEPPIGSLLNTPKLFTCNRDQDCVSGTTCELHTTGKYCV